MLHINPLNGHERLARLSSPIIESFRDELLKKGSRAMARKVLASLKSILGEAQRRGLVAHNAASPVRVDVKKRENCKLTVGRDIPSKTEAQTILSVAAGRWRPFFATAIFTGMRASELRGLIWDDVDFERNVIHVRQRANLWGEIGAPKSAAGDREIPMSPMKVNTLKHGGWPAQRGHSISFSRMARARSRATPTSQTGASTRSRSRPGSWTKGEIRHPRDAALLRLTSD